MRLAGVDYQKHGKYLICNPGREYLFIAEPWRNTVVCETIPPGGRHVAKAPPVAVTYVGLDILWSEFDCRAKISRRWVRHYIKEMEL